MSTNPLHDRQRTFAEKVAEGHNATEAYVLAGYRPSSREIAHRAASRLYRTPAVRVYIQDLRRTGDELAREQTTLTIAQKLAFLTRLVLTSAASLRADDPLIQSHRTLKDGSTSLRMPCKLKALKMHSDLAGHFPPEPTPPPKTSDPIQDLLDQIRRRVAPPPPKTSSPAAHDPLEGRAPSRPAHQFAKKPPLSHSPLALQSRKGGTKRVTRRVMRAPTCVPQEHRALAQNRSHQKSAHQPHPIPWRVELRLDRPIKSLRNRHSPIHP